MTNTPTPAGMAELMTDRQMVQSFRDHHDFALKGPWPGVQVPHYALAGLFKMAADRIEALAAQPSADPQTGRWYAAEDIDRMVRAIDVALNGDGAAAQAKLCDVFSQIIQLAEAQPSAGAEPGGLRDEYRLLLEDKVELWTGSDYLGDDRLEVDDALELADAIKATLAALAPVAAEGGEKDKLRLKLIDTLTPFAKVAEKLKHCHVVEICEPHPDNPSPNIIPLPREWFERAADDLEVIAIQLHADGVLSEGQTSKLTGLDRVEVRKEVDALRTEPTGGGEGT